MKVRQGLDRALDHRANDIRAASLRLRDGEISLVEWRRAMREATKDTHVYSAAAARGGFARMAPDDYGRVGALIKKQYGFLEKFLDEINNGLALDGHFVARSALYVQAARSTYERTNRHEQEEGGMNEEKNVLHPAEHCGQCVRQTARGWVRIGALVPIGERTCLGNDRCTMRYRRRVAR
jgi:hypothetical protein